MKSKYNFYPFTHEHCELIKVTWC